LTLGEQSSLSVFSSITGFGASAKPRGHIVHRVYTENPLWHSVTLWSRFKREPWLNSPLKAHREPQAAINDNCQLKLIDY